MQDTGCVSALATVRIPCDAGRDDLRFPPASDDLRGNGLSRHHTTITSKHTRL
ncbi:MAG: hypothetical protein OJF49_000328 [Ktedonobacterales bacterium]|nr:MAG: hypothetical protein OJF49_000328 [Ktedonobacterales bacterium]